jgi:Fe-S cluster biosynthesis and repair protein YggX
MEFPPFPGTLGERIFQNVSKKAWQAWLEQQKMLVNENRLNLADPEARKYLKEQTENYFFGDGADSVQGFVPVD